MRAVAAVAILVAIGVCAPRGWAQEEGDPAASPTAEQPPAPAADPELIRIHLMDGSTIAGKLSLDSIEVTTAYGTLSVPVTAIKSFTPGLVSHPEEAEDIARLIEELAGPNYNQREAAQKALVKLGPSVRGELARYADDADAERRSRIKTILEEFDDIEEEAAESGAATEVLVSQDTVVTAEFTIVGRIVPQSFAIESQYGTLSVELGDIRRGEREAPRQDIARTVRVGGSNIASLSMLNSSVRIERGDRVVIAAEGTLTMTPWGNEAQSTPDGAPNFGWFQPGQIPNGALVYRIGPSGQILKAGSRLTFTAERAGTLHLGIGMDGNFAKNNFPGEYRVKVRVERQ
jgi:hypothetical protein